MILAALLLASVTFRPAAPTVGDPVTIDFAAPVKVEPSPSYEIVSQEGKRVVVRTFVPKPFDVRGTMNGTPFQVRIPVKSVLQQGDSMNPAPLAPPRAMPYPREPFIAIAIAAFAAIVAWLFAFLRARKRREAPVAPMQSPEERFRAAVASMRERPSWARLADETRLYLASTRPQLSKDLTTTELASRLASHENFVAHILREGDIEKFSKRKSEASDFDESAIRALQLIPVAQEPAEEKLAS